MSGYELPGVTLTDVTDIKTAILSSTQRIPCFIGTASNQKTVVNEQVTRSTSGLVDQLVNYTTGITSVVKAGSQKGLSDIKENVDFSLNYNTGEITWLTNSESRSISSGVYGLELFKSLTTFAAFATATKGTDATSGKQGFGLDIIATADSGLALNTTYTFRVNAVDHSITTPSSGSFVSVATVAELVNTALASTQFTAEFSISDIYIINSVTGSSSTVTLAEGDSGNNLFSSLTGWSAFKTAVTGAVATSGEQSLGLTVVGTDNTGLAASTRYYFKINGVTYSFTTSTGTVTYTDLVTLLNTALSGTTITAALTGSDIVFTNSVTGQASIVTLGYAVAIAASNNRLKVNLSTGLIHKRLSGRCEITCTVNSENLTFGIVDEVIPGDKFIVLSGTNANLNKLTVGTTLTIVTSPSITSGGSYFVSYKYNRPESDYTYKEWTSLDNLKADYGDIIPDNQLVMMATLCFDYFGLPKIATVQVAATNQNSDYIAALAKCKNRKVHTIGLLNSSAVVRSAGISHVAERNLPRNAMYRMYYTGPSSLLPLGDLETTNSICGISSQIKNEAVIFTNCTRAKFYYKDPSTNLDTYTEVDGAFIGAAIGAYRDSYSYPAQTIMRHTVPGLELYAEDYETYYTTDMLKQAGEAGCLLVSLGSENSIFIKDDLTTDNTSVEANNINIVAVKHYIAKDVAGNLDNAFIGTLIIDRDQYKQNVEKYLVTLFSNYVAAKYIEKLDYIDVILPATKKDTVKIKYGYYAVYTLKYIEGEYEIVQ